MADPLQPIRLLVKLLPLCKALNIGFEHNDANDEVTFTLPYSEELIGDPHSGVIHGGAVSVLLDTACGGAVVRHPENQSMTMTISLRIDYLRPARAGELLRARAHVIETTRTVAFVRGRAWDHSYDNPVAMAAGSFTFSRREKQGAHHG